MLDPKFVRENEALVRKALKDCVSQANLDDYLVLERKRRELMAALENLKAAKNKASEEVNRLKKKGADAQANIAALQKVSADIKKMESDLFEVEGSFHAVELQLCNVPHDSVPVGPDSRSNVEVRRWGTPTSLPFEAKPHFELGVDLGILDFERAARMSGARFFALTGLGAKLERALMNFMLDLHASKGYEEVVVPHLVNRESMVVSGQFPRFVDQAFAIEKDGFYLVPTAEVPLTNLHRDEIFPPGSLPKKYCAHTPCYRREAGSYGQDTRGLIRLHQFNKVELFHFVEPGKSFESLEQMLADAEDVLQKLGLPYRVVVLATGDKSFTSAKTYDLEVWVPSQKRYREISSCSNCTDFQARRGKIRFKRESGGKTELVHTLNGSGLAVGRTWLAILENYQQADGSVTIPEVLRPYMGGLDVIKAH
jgi:seryl-tRNA synthetase